MRKIFILPFLLMYVGHTAAQSRINKVEILGANNFEYLNIPSGPVSKLIGNVQLKQQTTYLYCDSALIYENENKVEAFSNVRINHNDSVTITGAYLLYEGNTKKAYITKQVQMVDKNMTLTTEQLDYDLNNQLGYYENNGAIVSKENQLTSKVGYYFARQKEFFFKRNVVLTNPEYTVYSDTLMYNTQTRTAYFFGSSHIKGKTDEIFCENGWYNTEKDISQFSKNAVLFSDRKMLKADSLYYDRKKQLGKAFRNIHVYDSVQLIHLYGDYGQTNGVTHVTYVNRKSYAIKLMDKNDSLFLYGDTLLLLQQNEKQGRMLRAFHNVKLFKSDIQAVCDSLVYNNEDSTMSMFHDPVMWSGKSQITSDTIVFFINNNRLDSFYMLNNALVISKVKGLHYDQVKGKDMTGITDSSRVKLIRVYGNAQSIYYAKEDSLHFIGVNIIDCSEMTFYFNKGELDQGTFINSPDAVMYPLDELKPGELRLKGFKWQEKRRPQRIYF